MVSGVQPSTLPMPRTGLGCVIRNTSLPRAAKICPDTSLQAGEARATASWATWSARIRFFMRSTRLADASSLMGIVAIMRDQANGAMQFERTFFVAPSMARMGDRPDECGGGGEEDERAVLLLAEVIDGGAADIVAAVQMHIDQHVPVLVGHLVEHDVAQDSGGIDD